MAGILDKERREINEARAKKMKNRIAWGPNLYETQKDEKTICNDSMLIHSN